MDNIRFIKNIWIFWRQGENNAPLVVKKCIDSWRIKNPSWIVHLIDAENIGQFLDNSTLEMLHNLKGAIQLKADIIRLNLLKNHGRIWVDSTCFCSTPIRRLDI